MAIIIFFITLFNSSQIIAAAASAETASYPQITKPINLHSRQNSDLPSSNSQLKIPASFLSNPKINQIKGNSIKDVMEHILNNISSNENISQNAVIIDADAVFSSKVELRKQHIENINTLEQLGITVIYSSSERDPVHTLLLLKQFGIESKNLQELTESFKRNIKSIDNREVLVWSLGNIINVRDLDRREFFPNQALSLAFLDKKVKPIRLYYITDNKENINLFKEDIKKHAQSLLGNSCKEVLILDLNYLPEPIFETAKEPSLTKEKANKENNTKSQGFGFSQADLKSAKSNLEALKASPSDEGFWSVDENGYARHDTLATPNPRKRPPIPSEWKEATNQAFLDNLRALANYQLNQNNFKEGIRNLYDAGSKGDMQSSQQYTILRQQIERSANEQDPDYQYKFGEMLWLERKTQEALNWWEKAAGDEQPDALYALGEIALQQKKYLEALQYFDKASDSEHPKAQEVFNKLYQQLKENANKGDMDSLLILGEFSEGRVFVTDALKYYGQGAEKGDFKFKERYNRLFEEWKDKAHKGDTEAQYIIGSELSRLGKYEEALNYLSNAANAQFLVSGAKEEYDMLYNQLKKAADDNNDGSAQYLIGRELYRLGRKDEGLAYLRQAISNGYSVPKDQFKELAVQSYSLPQIQEIKGTNINSIAHHICQSIQHGVPASYHVIVVDVDGTLTMEPYPPRNHQVISTPKKGNVDAINKLADLGVNIIYSSANNDPVRTFITLKQVGIKKLPDVSNGINFEHAKTSFNGREFEVYRLDNIISVRDLSSRNPYFHNKAISLAYWKDRTRFPLVGLYFADDSSSNLETFKQDLVRHSQLLLGNNCKEIMMLNIVPPPPAYYTPSPGIMRLSAEIQLDLRNELPKDSYIEFAGEGTDGAITLIGKLYQKDLGKTVRVPINDKFPIPRSTDSIKLLYRIIIPGNPSTDWMLCNSTSYPIYNQNRQLISAIRLEILKGLNQGDLIRCSAIPYPKYGQTQPLLNIAAPIRLAPEGTALNDPILYKEVTKNPNGQIIRPKKEPEYRLHFQENSTQQDKPIELLDGDIKIAGDYMMGAEKKYNVKIQPSDLDQLIAFFRHQGLVYNGEDAKLKKELREWLE